MGLPPALSTSTMHCVLGFEFKGTRFRADIPDSSAAGRGGPILGQSWGRGLGSRTTWRRLAGSWAITSDFSRRIITSCGVPGVLGIRVLIVM